MIKNTNDKNTWRELLVNVHNDGQFLGSYTAGFFLG